MEKELRQRPLGGFKARGYKVAAQKLDPYINVDPGTMSPYQHGEVFVTGRRRGDRSGSGTL